MQLDPVTLEILGIKVAAATEEMGHALQRSGRTLYVKETADFSTALADRRGKFFAYPRGIGVSGFMDLDCAPTIDAVGPLEPGDVIVTNHPYMSRGLSTHLPDIHLIKPYFHDGEILCYGWTFVHSSDVGGRVPSSISPSTHEIFQEGLMIPPVKLVERAKFNADVVAFVRANCRTPDENLGDIKAMLAALGVGEKRVAQIVAQHGAEQFLAVQTDIRNYTAARARTAFRTIPDGRYDFWDYLDDGYSDPVPTRIRVALIVEDGLVKIDFTGSDPQIAAAFNVPTAGGRHSWVTLRLASVAVARDPGIPLNCGIFDPISVRIPEGSVLNPTFPAAVGVRHATTGRILDVLNGALAQAMPEFMPACSGGVIIPTVLAEPENDYGRRNVIVVEAMVGGTGGRHGADGADGRDSSTANLGNNPLETVEQGAGIIIHSYALRPDSGGPGRWRGGVGLEITFSPTEPGTQVLGRGMERFRFVPWGLAGGLAGEPARTILNWGRPEERELGKIDMIELGPDDRISILTPGGGGYGDPAERDPAMVLTDIRRGFVSAMGAERRYGVVTLDGSLDEAGTEALRARMRADLGPGSLFNFGPNRDAWDGVFGDALMMRIVVALMRLPQGARRRARARIFAPVLPVLEGRNLDVAGLKSRIAAVEETVATVEGASRGPAGPCATEKLAMSSGA